MQSALERFYPGMRMHLVCKTCKGNSERMLDRLRCPLCRKTKKDYEAAGLTDAVEEMINLHRLWLRLKRKQKPTTGVKKLDCALELLFGKPHNNNWRNYTRFPAEHDSPDIVLRTVNIGRVEIDG